MKQKLPPTDRTRIRRVSERANYDQAAIHTVLDEALFGTIAFNDETGVHAIPTAIWREEEYLYIHGSNGSRLLKFLQTGAQVCVAVTHIHGLVLARSTFHHSMNYSSVCIYGTFERVLDADKIEHMQRFVEHWMPGRWQHTRLPNKKELAATTIMRLSIAEAASKWRQGPPKDDDIDLEQRVWAGVVPLHLQWQTPQQVVEQEGAQLPGLSVRAL